MGQCCGSSVDPDTNFRKEVNRREIPPVKRQENNREIYIALFPYNETGDGDLTIQKGDRLALVQNQNYIPDWLCVEHLYAQKIGLVPKTYLAKLEGIEKEPWYFGSTSRAEAENLLGKTALPIGSFLVRQRENELDKLALTVKDSDENTAEIKIMHYKIMESLSSADNSKVIFISRKVKFKSISELIDFYREHTPNYSCRLTLPCPKLMPREYDLSPATQETGIVLIKDLHITEKIGEGNFADVWLAKWKGQKNVAVKMLKTKSEMSYKGFMAEAKLMKECRHDNLVSLFGICTDADPIYIVTEFMVNGNLLAYLRKGTRKTLQLRILIDICAQTAKGMAYLEQERIVHRDLAARNVLVGEISGTIPSVRVADFGMAKMFPENYECYVAKNDAEKHIPIKWTAPEALFKNIFSIKSDVWSFGVLLYEVVTLGSSPYPGCSNHEVAEMLQNGYRIPIPSDGCCPNELYEIMKHCWAENPDSRDTFDFLAHFLDDYFVTTAPTYMEG